MQGYISVRHRYSCYLTRQSFEKEGNRKLQSKKKHSWQQGLYVSPYPILSDPAILREYKCHGNKLDKENDKIVTY